MSWKSVKGKGNQAVSAGISVDVVKRLWTLVSSMRQGMSRDELARALKYDSRSLAADITRLRKCGVGIRFSRKNGIYSVEWPDETIAYRFSSEEYFQVFYVLKQLGEGDNTLTKKLALPLSPETNPCYDVGPAYGIQQNINADLLDLMDTLKDAIKYGFKAFFLYHGLGEAASIRSVHPYRLIHTPVSWYLVGFCEKRGCFLNFKLSRMEHLKLQRQHFRRRDFDIRAHLGDAWWLRSDPARLANPYVLRVRFKGEAAKTIREYKFHPSQTCHDEGGAVVVEWRLSYLGEFTSWLMQWLADIEVLEPVELRRAIAGRIKSYQLANP